LLQAPDFGHNSQCGNSTEWSQAPDFRHILYLGPKIKKGACNGMHWARGQQPLTQTQKQDGVVGLKLKNKMA